MARRLARIYGTEEDRINCPFYLKIGACRHEDRCSRVHHKPAFSPTLLIKHLYKNPNRNNNANNVSPQVAQEEFFCFFEDMFMELAQYGRVEELHVVDNLGDHLVGHVYVKFGDEEEAADAQQHLTGRLYDGVPVLAEYSPVTDFREARCRDFDEGVCSRGGFCNFLHVQPVPICLIRSLEEDAQMAARQKQEAERAAKEKRRQEKKEKKARKRQRRSGSSSDEQR